MARNRKRTVTLEERLERRMRSLLNELRSVQEFRKQMVQLVAINPQDAWAAGMIRHYAERTTQLKTALNALAQSVGSHSSETSVQTVVDDDIQL